jgi:hypothetical protein
LGREAGTIQRILHKAELSWGTYEDLLGFHCNAHPNNLAVVMPAEKEDWNAPWLAPLDFDMAFTKQTFLKDLDPKVNEEMFREYLQMEKNGMRCSLAGDNQLNSGATGTANLPKVFENLRWALRDTILLGFMSAYNDFPDKHSIKNFDHKDWLFGARSLIELALIVTQNQIA